MSAIAARRPLANCAANLSWIPAGSVGISSLKPKSPAAAAVPGGWSWATLQDAPYDTICVQPVADTLLMAPRPCGMSAIFGPAGGGEQPGSPQMLSGAMHPLVASLFPPPRPSSVQRRRWKFSLLSSAVRPAGSQKPTGSCMPSSGSGERGGEPVYGAQSTHAWPVRPAWRDMRMVARAATRPCAIPTASAICFTAGSTEASSLTSKSPAAGAVPSDWSWDNAQDASYVMNCVHPAAGIMQKGPSPLKMPANSRLADGDW